MDQILANVNQITGFINEIANSAREQSLGIAQAGQAIQKLDQDTQQNAAMVEQTASTSNLLKDQADSLLQDISRFKLS